MRVSTVSPVPLSSYFLFFSTSASSLAWTVESAFVIRLSNSAL
nr:MAG TPA: hypothetical protein [Caudoviricetes sp.]